MGHNPDQLCVDCPGRTRGPRVMRCEPCNEIAKKAGVERRRVIRSCSRCERPAAYRRRLCRVCQRSADREQRVRNIAASKRWKARNPGKVRAGRKVSYAKRRDYYLAKQKKYQADHREGCAANTRRHAARTKPWSKRRADALYAQARAAVSPTLPADVRDDTVSALILAVLEGRLDQNTVAKAASRFASVELRRYADVSLDAPMLNGRTRLENLRAPE